MTEKVNENISVRMGQEDIQKMDQFLAEHPELGGRSLFIRTAISSYINRDADVEDRKGDGIYVRLTPKELEAIDKVIETGEYLDRQDCVRHLVITYMHDSVQAQKKMQEVFLGVTSRAMQE